MKLPEEAIHLFIEVEYFTNKGWVNKYKQFTDEQKSLHTNLNMFELRSWALSVNVDLDYEFNSQNKLKLNVSNVMYEYWLWSVMRWVFSEPGRITLNEFLSMRQKQVSFELDGKTSKHSPKN